MGFRPRNLFSNFNKGVFKGKKKHLENKGTKAQKKQINTSKIIRYWIIVKGNVIDFVKEFHDGSKLQKAITTSFSTLILKQINLQSVN